MAALSILTHGYPIINQNTAKGRVIRLYLRKDAGITAWD